MNINRLKIWLKATRAPFLTGSIIPVALGTAVAWSETGKFNLAYFLWVLTGVSFLHLGTNLANDYFDHQSGNDWFNENFSQFNGGSRVIQDNAISARGILIFALVCFAAGSLLGLWINHQLKTNVVLYLGLAGVFCGFFYTATPLKIGYSGWGEAVVGLCFGPLVVLGSHYVQTQSFSWPALWASIPVGIMIGLILYINEFPDYLADKAVAKKTLVVRLGKKEAVKLYNFLLVMTYLIIFLGVLVKLLPLYTLIAMLHLPLAYKTMTVATSNYDKVRELLPANASTIGLHSLIGILLCAGFMLDKIL